MDKLPFDAYDFFGYISSGLLVVLGMNVVLGFPPVLGRDLKPFETACLILFVYIAGQIVAGPAKAVLEDAFVCRILGRPARNLLRERPSRLRFLFPGYFKQLPRAVREKVASRLGESAAMKEDDAQFLIVRFSPEVTGNDRLLARLNSFRDKYGFNRNLSFTAFVVSVALVAKHVTTGDALTLKWGITGLVGSVLLFYRYLKFFRQYSYELFNTYAGKDNP